MRRPWFFSVSKSTILIDSGLIQNMIPWLRDIPKKSGPTLPETNIAPEIDPGKGDSYWKPPFLGAMLVLGSVNAWSFFLVSQICSLERFLLIDLKLPKVLNKDI